jgi:hypothetical protein
MEMEYLLSTSRCVVPVPQGLGQRICTYLQDQDNLASNIQVIGFLPPRKSHIPCLNLNLQFSY